MFRSAADSPLAASLADAELDSALQRIREADREYLESPVTRALKREDKRMCKNALRCCPKAFSNLPPGEG